jgi:ABC-type transporter Mla subunit MlaD
MNRWFVLSLLIGCGGGGDAPPPGGATLHVLFDERHGLSGGEPVRMHDFDVGSVVKVDIASARVRATLSLDPDVASQLTRDSTFSVESNDAGTFLLAHVLDPEGEKLEAGGTLEGVDSSLELTLRRAGSSSWVRDAKGLVAEVERELGEVDWGAKRKEVEEQLDAARQAVEKATGDTSEAAKKGARALREQMGRLAGELEELGRTEEARKLRDQIEKLFGPEK